VGTDDRLAAFDRGAGRTPGGASIARQERRAATAALGIARRRRRSVRAGAAAPAPGGRRGGHARHRVVRARRRLRRGGLEPSGTRGRRESLVGARPLWDEARRAQGASPTSVHRSCA
jgi:hypothetical protein